jgi:hypothetical protein
MKDDYSDLFEAIWQKFEANKVAEALQEPRQLAEKVADP